MLIWQLRRQLRQLIRQRTFRPVTYRQLGKRRLVIGFVLFAFSWTVMGAAIYEKLFAVMDEETGEKYYIEVDKINRLAPTKWKPKGRLDPRALDLDDDM